MHKIAITGASGFIGKALAMHFHELGKEVICMLRDPGGSDLPGRQVYYDLEMQSFPLEERVDAVIHCAWGMQNGMYRTNIRACHTILRYADMVECQVLFLSSMSSFEGVRSEYARSKFMASKLFGDEGHLVLHPGLVIGKGGMFGRLEAIVSRLPIIPLPGRGKQIIQLIDLQDLIDASSRGIEDGIRGSYYLAYPDALEFQLMIRLILQKHGKKRIFLVLPIRVYELAIGFLYRLKLTSFSPDSLESLLHNPYHDTREDLAIFRIKEKSDSSLIIGTKS